MPAAKTSPKKKSLACSRFECISKKMRFSSIKEAFVMAYWLGRRELGDEILRKYEKGV